MKKSDLDLIKKSGLFNQDYYSFETNIKFNSIDDAITHYLTVGYKQDFNPSTKFKGNTYLKKYFDSDDKTINPLIHYLKYGKNEGKNDEFEFTIEEYNFVKHLSLFELKYYEEKVDIKFNTDFEGLTHYIEKGYKQNINPSEFFDGNAYLNTYSDVKRAKKNPLVHYVKFGINEGRYFSNINSFRNFKEIDNVNSILKKITDEISIIIPIQNIEKSIECVNQIQKTTKNFKIYLINLTNFPIKSVNFLDDFENIEIINPNPLESFTHILNCIVEKNNNDLIFLNENVLTFKNWVEKLIFAAYSNLKVGLVSPVSNYDGVKRISEANNENFVDLFNNMSKKEYNVSPFITNACIYIKIEVFRGGLKFKESSDLKNYLYNFYKLATEKGWKLVLDDSNFVYYNHERLSINSDPYILDNLPTIKFINSNAFKRMYENFCRIENNMTIKNKKNVLFSMHYGGGVEYAVKEIIKSIDDVYNCYLLKANSEGLILFQIIENCIVLKEKFILKNKWNQKIIHHEEFKQIYFYILINYNIDLVEIDHSIFHTFDLPYLCNKLNIPTVLIIHDFYYICPTYFLLDENYVYCGGHCGNKQRNCSVRVEWFDLPVNIVQWKHEWNKHVIKLFETVDIVVTATQFTKDMFLDYYPTLKDKDIQLIEHGNNLIRYSNLHSVPNNYQPIKLLIPGVIGRHKGSEFIKELKKIDKDNRLELHFMGVVDKELQEIGIYHGPYKRNDFSKFVYKIKPSFIGIFSICAETYSYTLTESISAGIPVFASNIGALKTRIEENGGGWLIDFTNPEETYKKILSVASDKDEYMSVLDELKHIKIVSSDEMGENYDKLYQKLIKKHCEE